eukprot:scpid51410/ scgid3350/ Protein white
MGKKVFLRWNDLRVSVPPPKPSIKERLFGGGSSAGEERQGRPILRKVNGVARPGDLIALMGSSGAGKTTLLNTLSRRNLGNLDVNGEILINGKPAGKKIGSISAYVQQEDLFLITLTVREHLRFQATLRMGTHLSLEQRYQRVEEVIGELGLQSCSNSQIGNNRTVQGISGGERKRLAFASEILEDPPLLFADEPTSGLDSFKAMSVVQSLQELAASGRTIICTIHQPPSEVFSMFNRLMLLAEGRMAYIGSVDGAVSHFATLGFSCPPHYNPADFFVHTLAIVPGKEEESKAKVKKINDAFAEVEEDLRDRDRLAYRLPAAKVSKKTSLHNALLDPASNARTSNTDGDIGGISTPKVVVAPASVDEQAQPTMEQMKCCEDVRSISSRQYEADLEAAAEAETQATSKNSDPGNESDTAVPGALDAADLEDKPGTPMVRTASTASALSLHASNTPKESIFVQAKALVWRSWVTTVREPLIVKVRVSQTLFLGILCGLIFLQLENDSKRVQNVAGALFFLTVQMSFGTIFPAVQTIPLELPVFIREHTNRMYRTSIYVMTKSLAAVPFNTVLPFVFITLAYWMIGLNSDVDRFFFAVFISILTTFSAESYAYLISAIARDETVALALMPPLVIPLMLFGGLFLNSDSTPVYFIWIEKISFIKYSFHAMMINEFQNAETPPCPVSNSTSPAPCFPDGNAVLRNYGMDPNEFSLNIGVLFALGVALRLLANFIIVWKARKH